MRILVHEFVSGGGLAGRPVKRSLAREGSAMRAALVADLAAMRCHEIVATADERFPLVAPPGVEVVTVPPARREMLLDTLLASADAVWLVAPENDGCLARLAARAERKGRTLLGPSAAAIRCVSNKAELPGRLARLRVRHPATRVLRDGDSWEETAKAIGYPLIVKPARGAGCSGVRLARSARELRRALANVRRSGVGGARLLQEYVPGLAASVSILADGRSAVALAVNRQSLRVSFAFSYQGGATPLDHPLALQAVDAALRTCRGVPGLRGYVGVDVVLTTSEAVVIEVNPRLTTAYLGVRMAFDENVAALALAACSGSLPLAPRARRRVRFTSTGRTVIT